MNSECLRSLLAHSIAKYKYFVFSDLFFFFFSFQTIHFFSLLFSSASTLQFTRTIRSFFSFLSFFNFMLSTRSQRIHEQSNEMKRNENLKVVSHRVWVYFCFDAWVELLFVFVMFVLFGAENSQPSLWDLSVYRVYICLYRSMKIAPTADGIYIQSDFTWARNKTSSIQWCDDWFGVDKTNRHGARFSSHGSYAPHDTSSGDRGGMHSEFHASLMNGWAAVRVFPGPSLISCGECSSVTY